MLNRVVLVGRITRDPELKYTQSNIPVVSFTLAVNRPYVDSQTGERQADFVQCVVWRKQAENLARYVVKGALLGVDGRLQTRTYESEQGTRYITEVVCDSVQFLETRTDENRTSEDDDFFEATSKLSVEDDLPF
ncbi:MAG: single-stranded DNA-binding protein [Acholeplasmataceae bacterium]|jgi:single-strand DNA-binding protein